MKKTGSEPSSEDPRQDAVSPSDDGGDTGAEAVERVRLQAEVAKQRVRIAKDELKRARRRLKEAKREARNARRHASTTRKEWKRARRHAKRNGTSLSRAPEAKVSRKGEARRRSAGKPLPAAKKAGRAQRRVAKKAGRAQQRPARRSRRSRQP